MKNLKFLIKRILSIGLALLVIADGIGLDTAFAANDETPPPSTTATATTLPPKEPLVEVSVDTLEISNNDTNVLGILWGQSSNPTGNQINFVESTVPALFNIGQLNRSQIAGQLEALIQTQQVRVLANPTLLTKSGFEANFLVGGEIPYPQVGQGGVSGVEYKKYGVALKILPVLTPRQTIDAQINVSVSNPDPSVAITVSGTSVPGLTSREAGTKVEVRDGETVVLAGIKESRKQKTVTRVPFLGSIPLLGLLFRQTNDQIIQTSLVLFVTFHLIK